MIAAKPAGMRRRSFASALAALLAAGTLPLHAQARKLRRIGLLFPFASDDSETPYRILAFEEGLGKLGWVRDETIEIMFRTAQSREQLKIYAKEMVDAGCEVLVGATNTALDALIAQTTTIPIVFVQLGDPVATGRLNNLARPGGNFTGFVSFEFSMLQKQVQIILAVAPKTKRIAILLNPDTLGRGVLPTMTAARIAADAMHLELVDATVHGVAELDGVFERLAGAAATSLIVVPDVFSASNRKAIVERATKFQVPTMYFGAYFVADGGLISYGIEPRDLYRRSASYVDKILNGANPGELPVQFPVRFEMAINLKAAENLGLTLPSAILAQAEQVFD